MKVQFRGQSVDGCSRSIIVYFLLDDRVDLAVQCLFFRDIDAVRSLLFAFQKLMALYFYSFCIIRKKTATAVAFAKQGRGLIKVNGQPIENIQPEVMRLKVFEPVLVLGQDKFSNLDIRVRVKGGGITAQIYAIRAAIAKSIVAYHAKYVDESSKNELRKTLIEYDRTLLVSDPRRCEPKKYGGRSARARFQKSYR